MEVSVSEDLSLSPNPEEEMLIFDAELVDSQHPQCEIDQEPPGQLLRSFRSRRRDYDWR